MQSLINTEDKLQTGIPYIGDCQSLFQSYT